MLRGHRVSQYELAKRMFDVRLGTDDRSEQIFFSHVKDKPGESSSLIVSLLAIDCGGLSILWEAQRCHTGHSFRFALAIRQRAFGLTKKHNFISPNDDRKRGSSADKQSQ
jgi:hypothetical protein